MDTVSSTTTSPEAVMIAVWTVWWVLWLAAAAWSDPAVKRPSLPYHILYRLFPALGAILLFGAVGVRSGQLGLWRTPGVLSWALVAIAIAGFAFTWWARIH